MMNLYNRKISLQFHIDFNGRTEVLEGRDVGDGGVLRTIVPTFIIRKTRAEIYTVTIRLLLNYICFNQNYK